MFWVHFYIVNAVFISKIIMTIILGVKFIFVILLYLGLPKATTDWHRQMWIIVFFFLQETYEKATNCP